MCYETIPLLLRQALLILLEHYVCNIRPQTCFRSLPSLQSLATSFALVRWSEGYSNLLSCDIHTIVYSRGRHGQHGCSQYVEQVLIVCRQLQLQLVRRHAVKLTHTVVSMALPAMCLAHTRAICQGRWSRTEQVHRKLVPSSMQRCAVFAVYIMQILLSA